LHEKKNYANLDAMKTIVIVILLGMYVAAGGAAKGDDSPDFQALVTGAEKGDMHAQYELGLQYRVGTIVEKNYAVALSWLTKAAEQGHVDAQNRVAIFYNNGEGTLPDRVKAYAWYLVASINGHKHAQAKQKIYESTLNKRQLYEGQKLARNIYEGIRETQQQINDSQ
jgi:TPR repeat protein